MQLLDAYRCQSFYCILTFKNRFYRATFCDNSDNGENCFKTYYS